MRFGAHHEWGKLREVVIGISPAEDFVVFHEDSQRWLLPEGDRLSRAHKGRRLIDIDPEWAQRIERQVEALAELVAREGVTVHRPQRLEGDERTFLAPNGEGAQLFAARRHDRGRQPRDRRLAPPEMPAARTLRAAADHPAGRAEARRALVERAAGLAGLRRRAVPRRRRYAAERLRDLCRHLGLRLRSCRRRLAAGAAGREVSGDPGGHEVERAAPRLRHGADQARPAGLLPAEADRRPADVAARLGQDRGLGRRGQPAGDQRAGPRGRPRHHRRRQRARDRRAAQAQGSTSFPCRSTARSRPAAVCAARTIHCCARERWAKKLRRASLQRSLLGRCGRRRSAAKPPAWACGRRRSAWAGSAACRYGRRASARASPPGRRRSAAARA